MTVESRSNSADTLSVSNNIYPIFTDDDEIDGVLEFLYLNKLNLNKVNKIIGHAAEYTFDSIIGESEEIRQSIAVASEFATAGRNSVLIVGRAAWAKSCSPRRFTITVTEARRRLSLSTVLTSRKIFFESELFGYVGGHLQERQRTDSWASSSWQTAGRCSWTRSGRCHSTSSQNCSVFLKPENYQNR